MDTVKSVELSIQKSLIERKYLIQVSNGVVGEVFSEESCSIWLCDTNFCRQPPEKFLDNNE